MLKQFGVDIWLFTHDQWLITNPDGHYNPFEKRTIKADPIVVDDLSPYLSGACKIVGSSSDAELLQRCEAAMQTAVGDQATAARSQSYYLDITPPGVNKGTFVKAMAARLGISTDAVATVGDMHNDVAMFQNQRHVDRDGQRDRRHQAAGHACHDLERRRGFRRRDGYRDEEQRRQIMTRSVVPANTGRPGAVIESHFVRCATGFLASLRLCAL